MKMKHLIVAAAVASLPATTALAQGALDKKKAAAEAKAKAIEEAKQKAKEEMEAKAKANAAAAAKANAAKADKAAASEEAKKAEDEAHAKFLGQIERLEQIATATDNAELKAKVSALKAKAEQRRTLATAG
jgi:colicin import membrane protein